MLQKAEKQLTLLLLLALKSKAMIAIVVNRHCRYAIVVESTAIAKVKFECGVAIRSYEGKNESKHGNDLEISTKST
jgi:hypothetical protein